MAARYDALVAKVRDWANRDEEALPDSIIQDSLDYAADVAYRTLRVPSLETIATFTIPSTGIEDSCIQVPEDLSEFISLRRLDQGGPSSVNQVGDGRTIVYNQKSDYRTFRDLYADQYNYFRWTRVQDDILIYPPIETGQRFELFYYRRLPALNARYAVIAANQARGLLVQVDTPTLAPRGAETGSLWRLRVNNVDTYYDTLAAANAARAEGDNQTPVETTWYGVEAPHWLRDEQEKILLWGALVHIFNYLGEDQMAAKFLQLFQEEMQELNHEEGRRKVSGANTQQNFDGFLI